MLRIFQIIFVGILVDFMYIGAAFRFLPSVNMKQIMAIFGVALMVWHVVQTRRYQVSKDLLICGGISVAFSLMNLIAIEYNETYDYVYANYVTSFLTWVFSGYTAMSAMRWVHGKATISLLAAYLAGVCAIQCVFALWIDNSPALKAIVDSTFVISSEFFEEIGRIYGLGLFMLDPAGVRMSCVAILICHVLALDEEVQKSKGKIFYFVLCLMIMIGIGNIVSRTTTVGVAIGLVGLFLSSRVWTLQIKSQMLRLTNILLVIILIAVPLAIYLYNTDPYFYSQFRYGFEGFFNYFEKGEFRTTSTDILKNSMWIWPETLETWIIGTGLFSGYLYHTDIGYCRFILYSGLLGFGTFASMFVYLAFSHMRQYPRYALMFFSLGALSFIIWIKVSTDILAIWGLLLFLDKDPNYNHNAKHIIG